MASNLDIGKKKNICITVDVDWAPDFVFLHCLDIFDELKIKAVFFVTHPTEMNSEAVVRGHQLAIHPNFLQNSTQGKTVTEVMEYCLKLVPDAWAMRTHCLFSSTTLLIQIAKEYPQISTDVSLLSHRSTIAKKVSEAPLTSVNILKRFIFLLLTRS